VASYYLGIDFGLKHIGVAVGQPVTHTASPLVTVAAQDGQPDWAHIGRLLKEYNPSDIVVGLPLNMDGSSSEMAAAAADFAAAIRDRFGVSVTLIDERLTSWSVQNDMEENNSRPQSKRSKAEAAKQRSGKKRSSKSKRAKSGPDVHQHSACLILETWMNENL
tara:strand:- start:1472 stop:1960 length:489 start_codon:yes stop_codon:yes gene_type:complete